MTIRVLIFAVFGLTALPIVGFCAYMLYTLERDILRSVMRQARKYRPHKHGYTPAMTDQLRKAFNAEQGA